MAASSSSSNAASNVQSETPHEQSGTQRRKRYTDDVSVIQNASIQLATRLNGVQEALRSIEQILADARKNKKVRVKDLTDAVRKASQYTAEANECGATLFKSQQSFQTDVGQALLATLKGRSLSANSDTVPVAPINRAHEVFSDIYPLKSKRRNTGNIWSECDEWCDLLEHSKTLERQPPTPPPPRQTIHSASAFFGVVVSDKTRKHALPPYAYSSEWLRKSVLPTDENDEYGEARTMALGANNDEREPAVSLSSRRDAAEGVSVLEMPANLSDCMTKVLPPRRQSNSKSSSTASSSTAPTSDDA